MAWQELSLRLPADAFARTEALLVLAGATSIAVSDDGDLPILEPPPDSMPLWPRLKIRALFENSADLGAIGKLIGPLEDGEIVLERIDERALLETAADPIRPLSIGPRLSVVPADALNPSDESNLEGSRVLGLHMGLAFGTGRHPTTRLCLEWLEREIRPGISVLDYGAGSGILALAALKLGALRATAVDIEPQALTAMRHNAGLNGLDRAIRIGPPEILEDERFDLIVANILARPLIELARAFADRQPQGGRIVVSGILVSQLDELESHYAQFYETFTRAERSGWALLTARRRSRYDR